MSNFAFTFNGKRITGTADVDDKGYFITDTIELEQDIIKESDFSNEIDYWHYIDGLCEAFDEVMMFDREVNSIHII